MWANFWVAIASAVLSLAIFAWLAKAKAPEKVSVKEALALNTACVLSVSIFGLFFDTHGPSPAAAYVIAGLEPLILAAALAIRRKQHRAN